MNPLWSYFWPVFAVGLVIGGIAGSVGFRRRGKGAISLGIGIAVTLAATIVWHGPLGAAQRLTTAIERDARATLDFYEMSRVTGHLHHGPLTRHVVLIGPADTFQRTELVRTIDTLPGVAGAGWADEAGALPMIVEAAAVTLAGFLFGLLLAYLVELRRRYNAQWTW